MAIEVYKGIKIPTELTDTINSGTDTPGGIIIDNDKALADRVTDIEDRNLTNWKFGDATPGASLNPEEGDAYFRSDGKVYVYSNSVWSVMADLKGPQGSSGANGNSCTAQITSSGGVYTLTITNTDTQGNTSTSTATIYQGSNGVDGQDGQDGSDGQDGQDGTKIFRGTAVTGTSGEISATVPGSRADDIYINTSSFNFYTASAPNTWNYEGCLKGANGNNGSNGSPGADGFTPTITVSNKINGVQTLTVTNKTGSTTTTINDGITGWNEATLVNGSNVLSDGDSVYSSIGMSAASISVTNAWSVGATARVGITFASSSTFSYPNTWICIGDDCASGVFTFSQGSSYWLTIEYKPDGTWMTVIKVPS